MRLGLLLSAALLPAVVAAQAAERYTLRGGEVAIYDPAGRIQLVAGSGPDVTAEVIRRGRDAGRLRVVAGSIRGHDALRVIAPAGDLVFPELGRSSNVTLRVRSDGTFGGDEGGIFSRFSSDKVTIRGDGGAPEAWAEVTVYVPAGRRVAVHVGAGTATARNVDGDLTFDVHAGEVTTDRTRGRLVVDAGSGRVHIHDAQGPEVNLDTGSGGVEMRGVRTDRLRIDAGSGNVEGGDVDAGDANLDVGSGGLRLDRTHARTLKVDAGSGGIDLELAGTVENAHLDTGSGGVTLRIPPTLGATLDVDVGSGGIHTDVPIQVTRSERDHLTGRVGDGRGRITIEAGSGSVRIAAAR